MTNDDSVYRQIKARAALRGQSIRAFFLKAIKDKLAADRPNKKGPSGWRSVFGKGQQKDIDELQRIIDDEFLRINPDDWRRPYNAG